MARSKKITETKAFKCKWYDICSSSYKNKTALYKHETLCNAGAGTPCPLKPPCNTIFKSDTRYREHVHSNCKCCGTYYSSKDHLKKHMEKHPSWGSKHSTQMHKLLSGDTKAIDKAIKLNEKFERMDFVIDEGESICYQISQPFEEILCFDQAVSLLKYPGRSAYHKSLGTNPARYSNYVNGCHLTEDMHVFFDEYATSDQKPFFITSFPKESKAKASVRENLMIYTLGAHNLINKKGGDALPNQLAKWDKEDKALLGAYFVYKFYEYLKSTNPEDHLRINYSRLNDSKYVWPAKQDEKAEKVVLAMEQLMEQLMERLKATGANTFEFSAVGSEFLIKPIEKADIFIQNPQHEIQQADNPNGDDLDEIDKTQQFVPAKGFQGAETQNGQDQRHSSRLKGTTRKFNVLDHL